MVKKSIIEKCEHKCHCGGGTGNAVYGLGFIGALVFFFQHSATAGDYFMGILKAIFWPAILIYKVLQLLGF